MTLGLTTSAILKDLNHRKSHLVRVIVFRFMTSRKQCVFPSVPESLNVYFINLPLQVAQERGSRCQNPSRCLRTAVRPTVSAAHRARRVQAAVMHRAAGRTAASIGVMLWRRMEEYVI